VIHEIYLDNNATTYPLVEVQDAICEAVKASLGNPSSEHRSGERSRKAIAAARFSLAELLQAPAENLVFGSGVTELNNWVISRMLDQSEDKHLITSTVEHSSVIAAAHAAEHRGARVTWIPVRRDGVVDLERLESSVNSSASLVSIQWVNNETGAIQPVSEIARICNKAGVSFHCDAAQAVGKLEINLSELKVDFVTISAHKMNGPPGVGALAIRDRRKLSPLLFGGGQEFGLRPGTENILGIIGFGVAAAVRFNTLNAAITGMTKLRDSFESMVTESFFNVTTNGSPINRVCNTTNLMFRGVDGSALVALLDKQGVRCSQASACNSSRPEPSHVLLAMGLTEEEAFSSIRFSFSHLNTSAEVDLSISRLHVAFEKLTSQKYGSIDERRMINHEI
jgi:cysteine desulfurase